MAFVPVTAEQVPALRQAGLLWYKHYDEERFAPLPVTTPIGLLLQDWYQWHINRGTVYAILLEE